MNGLHLPGLLLSVVGGGSAPPTTLPTGMTQHWEADDIPPQADGSSIVSWTARVGGTSLTVPASATSPQYAVNALGGLPGVRFPNRRGALTMGTAGSDVLRTALNNNANSTGCTQVIVCKTANLSTAVALITGWENVNDSARSVTCSIFSWGYRSGAYVIAQQGDLSVIIMRSSSVITNGANQYAHIGQNMHFTTFGTMSPLSADYLLGNDGVTAYTTDRGFQGLLFAYLTYPRCLTLAECARITRHYHLKYGLTVPWSTSIPMCFVEGDSYSQYPISLSNDNWSAKMQVSKSIPFNNISLLAISSRTSTEMLNAVTANYGPGTVLSLRQELGTKWVAIGYEFANNTEPTAATFISWANAVKTLEPTTKICGVTAWDNGATSGGRLTDRIPFCNSVVAAAAPSGPFDVVAPIHLDANMGVDGACPVSPGPYGPYFADFDGHPSSSGSPNGTSYFATYMGPYYDQLIALA